MSQLTSAYSHIAKYAGRNRGKADSFYNRCISYKRIDGLETTYIVRDDLLPKRAICSKCDHWFSQTQTQASIAVLRRNRTAYCPYQFLYVNSYVFL